MSAKIVAEEGSLKGLVLSLDNGEEWIVGRDPDSCQLLIEDPAASRKHFICRNTPQGIVLENLSETNPIEINEEVIQEPRLLKNGDTIKIGSGIYRFYSGTEAQLINGEHEMDNQNRNHPSNQQDELESNTENNSSEGELSSQDSLPEEEINHPSSEEKVDSPEIKTELLSSPEIEKEEPLEIKKDENSPLSGFLKDSSLEDSIFQNAEDSIYQEESSDSKDDLAEINFDLGETGRWLLKVVNGANAGAEFSMQNSTAYLIGTDPNACDIVFHDTSVSRQHARLTITDNDTMILEDLKSRNGTAIDGEPITGKHPLSPNSVVSMGMTTFVVYDREGEMQTIISPLLPSIVKVLQKEEEKKPAEISPVAPAIVPESIPLIEKKRENTVNALGAFLFLAILTGIFVIVGIGTTTLFKSEPIAVKEQVDPQSTLKTALAQFPDIKFSFNASTGRLLLVGHVLTNSDRSQLLYNLQGMPFIKTVDDSGVVIDEGVWREINQIIAKNPEWKSISIHSNAPGNFILTGTLQTRREADQLWDYISNNFPYLDLLQKKVMVEEDVVNSVTSTFVSHGLKDVTVKLNEGDLTLSGSIPRGKNSDFNAVVAQLKNIPGVRNIKSLVTEIAPDQSMINVSDKYEVTGVSFLGGKNTSVIINGRILTQGDSIDGMTIKSIKPNVIFLEKDGVQYRIDYSR